MSKTISMDARKVVKFINESVQRQLASIGNCVKRLGDKLNRNYSLVAVHKNSMLFEDVDANKYYFADYKYNDNHEIFISNIRGVDICESRKEHVFNNACVELVEAISEGDNKGIEAAFKKIDNCRYRSTLADSDGCVVTKDGVRRKLYEVNNKGKYDVNVITEMADAIRKVVFDDNVIIEDNQVVCAILNDGKKIKIPINEEMRRRSVARQMAETASNAWSSPRFQKLVLNVASMIAEDKLQEAIVESAKFLKEYQEFCMLDKKGFLSLIEKTLATQNIYNPVLVEDVTLLMYKTNAKVNKKDIVESWKQVAKLVSNHELLEEVNKLCEADNFEEEYDKFVGRVLSENKMEDDLIYKFALMIQDKFHKAIEARKKKMASEKALKKSIEDVVREETENQDVEFDEDDSKSDEISDKALAELQRSSDRWDELVSAIAGPETRSPADVERVKKVLYAVKDHVFKSPSLYSVDKIGDEDAEIDLGMVGDELDKEEKKSDTGKAEAEEVGEAETGGIGAGAPTLGGLGGFGAEEGEPGAEGEAGEEGEAEEEGEAGEEEGKEKKEKKETETEEELNKLLAASREINLEKEGLSLLQEAYVKMCELREEARSSPAFVNVAVTYADKCRAFGNEHLSQLFKQLIDDDDNYDNCVVKSECVDVDKLYKYGERSKKVISEAQYKHPTKAKSKTRPSVDKSSLMKDDVNALDAAAGGVDVVGDKCVGLMVRDNNKGDEKKEQAGVSDVVVSISTSSLDSLQKFADIIGAAIDAIENRMSGEGDKKGGNDEEDDVKDVDEKEVDSGGVDGMKDKGHLRGKVIESDKSKDDGGVTKSPTFGSGPFKKI